MLDDGSSVEDTTKDEACVVVGAFVEAIDAVEKLGKAPPTLTAPREVWMSGDANEDTEEVAFAEGLLRWELTKINIIS